MGSRKVDLERLAATLPDYPFAYLITVDDSYCIHTVTVEPKLREERGGPQGARTFVDVGLIGGQTRKNIARHNEITLLWPPPEPGGYSLIVDGRAEATQPDGETAPYRVIPTRALLHREADSPSAAKGCLHDCIVFSLPT